MNITRHQQLLSQIKRIISTQLQDLDHELFHLVVITDVLLSNDGRECRVYVTAPEKQIKLLNTTYRSEMQRRFMKNFARKIVPQLLFLKDTGEVERMEALLEQDKQDAPS